jgi:hypothetical protein
MYPTPASAGVLRIRQIHETFAEAYAMLVCERVAELGHLASELIDILQAVPEDPNLPYEPRWQLDLKTGISASLMPTEALSHTGPAYELDDVLAVRPTSVAREALMERATQMF